MARAAAVRRGSSRSREPAGAEQEPAQHALQPGRHHHQVEPGDRQHVGQAAPDEGLVGGRVERPPVAGADGPDDRGLPRPAAGRPPRRSAADPAPARRAGSAAATRTGGSSPSPTSETPTAASRARWSAAPGFRGPGRPAEPDQEPDPVAHGQRPLGRRRHQLQPPAARLGQGVAEPLARPGTAPTGWSPRPRPAPRAPAPGRRGPPRPPASRPRRRPAGRQRRGGDQQAAAPEGASGLGHSARPAAAPSRKATPSGTSGSAAVHAPRRSRSTRTSVDIGGITGDIDFPSGVVIHAPD